MAILIDIRQEEIDTFNQKLEDLINSFGARLIYRKVSRFPLRIVWPEEAKYPPSYSPMPPARKGVRDELFPVSTRNAQGTPVSERPESSDGPEGSHRRYGLDGADHRSDRAVHHRRGAHSDVRGFPDRLRQREYGPGCSGHSVDWTDFAFGRLAPVARVHASAKGSKPDVNKGTSTRTGWDSPSPIPSGSSSFLSPDRLNVTS